MQNLAGRQDCDKTIESELRRCNIEVVHLTEQPPSEVPASIEGKLGPFKFTRAWYYWVVKGNVPLSVAQELYQDPVGKTDIRVAGHCGCPPPEEPWITWLMPDDREVIPAGHESQYDAIINRCNLGEDTKDGLVFSDEPESLKAKAYVESYHIDSEVGLRIFADTIRKYGLDKIT